MWFYVEARELASSALVDADELVKYDWYVLVGLRRHGIELTAMDRLTPNI